MPIETVIHVEQASHATLMTTHIDEVSTSLFGITSEEGGFFFGQLQAAQSSLNVVAASESGWVRMRRSMRESSIAVASTASIVIGRRSARESEIEIQSNVSWVGSLRSTVMSECRSTTEMECSVKKNSSKGHSVPPWSKEGISQNHSWQAPLRPMLQVLQRASSSSLNLMARPGTWFEHRTESAA